MVNKVIKAGSLGHGTAVPGHYDLDVVLYSNSEENSILPKHLTLSHTHRS